MASPSSLYLFAYNSLQALGWAFALSRILSGFAINKSVNGAYASAGELICLLQTVAFLEVVHGAIGIVPSGVGNTLLQWGGRVHFLLVVRQVDEVKELPSVFITFVAWSLSEAIRYPHYALNCIGRCPSWITYLRYSAFIVLYPIGVGPGEMWLLYQALPFMRKEHFRPIFLKVLLLCYPFLFLKLYLHIFKQRKSKLGKHHGKKKL